MQGMQQQCHSALRGDTVLLLVLPITCELRLQELPSTDARSRGLGLPELFLTLAKVAKVEE